MLVTKTSKRVKVLSRRNLRRRRRFILSGLICAILLFHVVRTFSMSCQASWERPRCPQYSTSWAIDWVSCRSKLFAARWNNYKARNFAVYVCVSTRRVPLLNAIIYHTFFCPDVFYNVRYDELFEVARWCFSHTCLKRIGRSHYVYAEFVLNTFDAIVSSVISPVQPRALGKIAVLLEPRQHPLLEYTVKQVMLTLDPTWSLQIFVSSSNENFVRRHLRVYHNDTGRNIILTKLEDFGLDDIHKYGNRVQSAFSAHEGLYHAIPSEHILWFQLDVVMRGPLKDGWLKYAYVGAEWKGCQHPSCPSTCDKICGGGNSGLSLRRRSMMLRVATRGKLPEHIWGVESNCTQKSCVFIDFTDSNAQFVSDEMHDNSKTHWFEDDLQLSHKLLKLGLLPPGQIPPRFALAQALPIEGLCETNPSGLHKPWDTPWISPIVIMRLLSSPFTRSHTVGHKRKIL